MASQLSFQGLADQVKAGNRLPQSLGTKMASTDVFPRDLLPRELIQFRDFGTKTLVTSTICRSTGGSQVVIPTYVNEFWTARQRAANRLHEISYRACFKPQLPRFFMERLTRRGHRVYDPFMGRGTTLLEAALLERIPLGCDINPLSRALIQPRLCPPNLDAVRDRLDAIDFRQNPGAPDDLLVFFHPDTLRQISALRHYLLERTANGDRDNVDDWIAMVGLNRLTGHSAGFFSVYTMPPNQAVSVASQRRINQRRNQAPTVRDVPGIILKKSRSLLGDCTDEVRRVLARHAADSVLVTGSASVTPEIPDASVDLVVTSPPFLNVVNYTLDNWMRCWFVGLDAETVPVTTPSRLATWREAMTDVFRELHRIVKPGGHVAFEVGEVHGGKTRLEEAVVPCGLDAGLMPQSIVINAQEFTKTANCWGVSNNSKGTNTNRIVVFQR